MFDLLPYQEHFMLTCSRYHFPCLLDKWFSDFSSKIWIIALKLRSLLKVGRSKFITNEEILKNKPATILRKYWYLNVFEFYDALFFKWRKTMFVFYDIFIQTLMSFRWYCWAKQWIVNPESLLLSNYRRYKLNINKLSCLYVKEIDRFDDI